MKSYKQLTSKQRNLIYRLIKKGISQAEIANRVGTHKSTVSRELTRNCGLRGYRPRQAQKLCEHRRKTRSRKRITATTWRLVRKYLKQNWSPQKISQWLLHNHQIAVSHEWIYKYIITDKHEGGTLYQHLYSYRRTGKYNKRR